MDPVYFPRRMCIYSHPSTALHVRSPQLAKRLEGMEGEEFGAHVEELAKAKLEAPKRLREAAGRAWRELDDGTGRWVMGGLGAKIERLKCLAFAVNWAEPHTPRAAAPSLKP